MMRWRPHAPRIAALILAAGRSTRYGGSNKLLDDLDGIPIVRHVAQAALQSRARPVVVVTGHSQSCVASRLTGLDVQLVHNPNYAQGAQHLAESRSRRAASRHPKERLVCLGDMPQHRSEPLDRLIAAFAPKEGRLIAVPVHKGKRGNPVLFGRALFAEMLDAEGDTGARHIIGTHADEVDRSRPRHRRIFADVDTPEALERLQRKILMPTRSSGGRGSGTAPVPWPPRG